MSPIFIDTQLQNPYTPTHKKELFANQNSHTKRSLLMMESLINTINHQLSRWSKLGYAGERVFYLSPAPLRLCSGSLEHAEFAESDVLVGPIS